jgi:hypothetical protein
VPILKARVVVGVIVQAITIVVIVIAGHTDEAFVEVMMSVVEAAPEGALRVAPTAVAEERALTADVAWSAGTLLITSSRAARII